jgi:fluoroquinolone transport system permease protein
VRAFNRRLVASLRTDVRLQYRNGLYHVAAAIVAIWAVVIAQLPALELRWLIPVLVLGSLVVSTYYFAAGLILLERAEGSLQALTVTPLRPGEYLASKVLSLTALAMVENLVLVCLLVVLAGGFGALAALGIAGWTALIAGTAAAGAFYVLLGFANVSRYASINEFIIPSVLYTSLLTLPLVGALGQWEHWLFFLHPLQAPLVLLRSALEPIPPWQIGYGIVASILWIALAFAWAKRSFAHFVIATAAG